MTVAELIAKLEAIEDKSMNIYVTEEFLDASDQYCYTEVAASRVYVDIVGISGMNVIISS
jgi:hypothetical protein